MPGRRSKYQVAAVLGDPSYGYFAAAVYSCRVTEDANLEGFGILARSPFNPGETLRLLKERLLCMGFPLDDPFVLSTFDAACVFFDSGKGFDIVTPIPPVPLM